MCVFLFFSAQILPEFTSIVVRPQPNVILQTLPDVVTEFFDTIPPPGSVVNGSNGSSASVGFDPKQSVWNNNNIVVNNVRCKQEVRDCSVEMDGSGSSLADLDCLTDLLGGSQNCQSGPDQLLKLELIDSLDDDDKLDTCWESGSSSSSGGSHFEFSCTPDVSDMLSDIGVSEVDWGCDDMMMIKI